MKRKLFGTDGIRGTANRYPMDCDTALTIGKATARIFKKPGEKNKCKIITGRDTRISGGMLENAVAAGICSEGVDVVKAGVLTTPGVSFITEKKKALAGIVISASHNPFQDNGIKIFTGDGLKLSDEKEGEIENLIFNFKNKKPGIMPHETGRIYNICANRDYVNYLKKTFPKNLNLDGLKIVVDCANGADYIAAPEIFKKSGAFVIAINNKPDGININLNCGATDTKMLRKSVIENDADAGIAVDGDGDRVIFVDERGNVIDGDGIMALCACDLKGRGKLKKDTIVATVMSNMGLEIAMKNHGIRVVRTAVGDRYVLEEMLKNNYNFGGEQSGHIIFPDYAKTGDALISAIQVLCIMKRTGKKLSELSRVMERLPQVLINVKIKAKKDINKIPEIKDEIFDAEKKLAGKGRVLVRFSGTEALCRVMVEAQTGDKAQKIAGRIAGVVERNLS